MGRPNRPSREDREAEFIEAIEQLLGFPLMEWQKPYVTYIRRTSLSGKPINFEVIKRRQLDDVSTER